MTTLPRVKHPSSQSIGAMIPLAIEFRDEISMTTCAPTRNIKKHQPPACRKAMNDPGSHHRVCSGTNVASDPIPAGPSRIPFRSFSIEFSSRLFMIASVISYSGVLFQPAFCQRHQSALFHEVRLLEPGRQMPSIMVVLLPAQRRRSSPVAQARRYRWPRCPPEY